MGQNLPKCTLKHPEPKIYFTMYALLMQTALIKHCRYEIGWYALVQRRSDLVFVVYDILLWDQEVHATTTEISPEALFDWYQKTDAETQKNLRYWGHSHVKMPCNPSAQDDLQFKEFGNNPSPPDYMIRAIGNKHGQLRLDIAFYSMGMMFENVPFGIITTDIVAPDEKKLREEIEQKVKYLVATTTYGGSGSSTYYGNGYNNGYNTGYNAANKAQNDSEISGLYGFNDDGTWDGHTPIPNGKKSVREGTTPYFYQIQCRDFDGFWNSCNRWRPLLTKDYYNAQALQTTKKLVFRKHGSNRILIETRIRPF